MTYQEAEKLFATARDKSKGKKLENNTYIVKDGDNYAVRLHWTNVVTIHPDGTFTLNSGGCRTMTTKARINEYAPVYIFQRKGEWFIDELIHFFDGMKVTAGGAILY